VGGQALRGPADRMLRGLGHAVSPVGVARLFHGLVDALVLDEVDAALADLVRALGMDAVVGPTIMRWLSEERVLARRALEAVGVAAQRGCDALLVLPADVPLVTARDVEALLELAEPGRGVALCPDRAGSGTNALLRRPPAAIPARFGPHSLARHRRTAALAG